MYLLILLLAWILGIATMGRVFSEFLTTYSTLIFFLCIISIFLKLFKFNWIQGTYFRIFQLALSALTIFLLGHIFASNALEERLEQRVQQVEEKELTIYADNLNELKIRDGKDNVEQKVSIITPNENSNAKLLLYIDPKKLDSELSLGQYYRVRGIVKPAHGYAIPHVFDQEKWFIQQNVVGTMQVLSVERIEPMQIQQMVDQRLIHLNHGWFDGFKIDLEKQRLKFRTLIKQQSFQNKGLLLALLTGDESLLSESTKLQFKTLGISHLLAISGPHVLILAVLFCYLSNAIVSRFKPSIFKKIPRPYLLVFPFLSCVLLYTAFVGFEIPALRTCLTVIIISIALLFKQQIHALKLVLFSASVLLLIDPFSILSPAFWLSYGACFILIRVYQTLIHKNHHTEVVNTQHWVLKVKQFLWVLFDSQWKVFIALFPLVAIIFQQVSWISPLINLIAIPIIGLLVVPLEVVAACISLIIQPLGVVIFHLADLVLTLLTQVLNIIQNVFQPKLHWLSLSVFSIVSLAVGILILFLPKSVLPKSWAFLCCIPLFIPHNNHQAFKLSVLDVGQGQAIHVQFENHHVMMDTGGFYDENKFSVGERLIIPYLMGEGIAKLDQVYLTHLDQDHAGAFSSINQVVEIDQVFSNERDERFSNSNFNYCYSGQRQQFGDVTIQVLAPQQDNLSDMASNRNELSCVLYIQVPRSKGYQNFLIMGDAGWQTEYELLQRYPDLKVDVLMLGHHGSQHSSSYDFLKRLKPKLAVASAGYNNKYHHPHAIVKARLDALNIPLKTTIDGGSISFKLDEQDEMGIEEYRMTKRWLSTV